MPSSVFSQTLFGQSAGQLFFLFRPPCAPTIIIAVVVFENIMSSYASLGQSTRHKRAQDCGWCWRCCRCRAPGFNLWGQFEVPALGNIQAIEDFSLWPKRRCRRARWCSRCSPHRSEAGVGTSLQRSDTREGVAGRVDAVCAARAHRGRFVGRLRAPVVQVRGWGQWLMMTQSILTISDAG